MNTSKRPIRLAIWRGTTLTVIRLVLATMVRRIVLFYLVITSFHIIMQSWNTNVNKHVLPVSVLCKDTRIAVQVRTNKPFNGRIYALGRSETCNIDVLNSDLFRLDLTMAGQDCNTQSAVSICNNALKYVS